MLSTNSSDDEEELSEKFLMQVGVHQGSALSPLLFTVVVDVITENERKVLRNEILCVYHLVS